MKKIILSVLMLMFCILTLASCRETVVRENLIITSTSKEYYLDKKSDSNYSLKFDISDSSVLTNHLKEEIVYYIKGENPCEAVIANNTFTANKVGKVKVSARINDLESTNSIDIEVKISNEFIAANEKDISDKIEELSKNTIDFGSINNIGISKENADKYKLIGCDDIMFINDEGLLEVCGIMLSTEVKLHSDITGKDIWVGYLSSTFGTILATSVKNELISNNTITNTDTKITKNQLLNVKKLNLDGLIANDVTSINGIKWLPNIEELNLSNNGIDNIDFALSASKLKKLIISNNNISTLVKKDENDEKKEINVINAFMEIEYLDISNNLLTSIPSFQNLLKLKYLNLDSNNIKDITNVGNLINLESLFLNNNKLDPEKFKDAFAQLNNLKELGLGYCGLTFNDIISIQFINKDNIEYLDFSGTSVNLNNVVEFKNLKTLILQDANLNEGADISKINDLSNLGYLDISNNSLNTSHLCTQNKGVLKFKLDSTKLINLDTLCIGGNEFSTLPNLSDFAYLNTLDLTNSYNLKSLDSLGNLNIKELILDECNSIKIEDGGVSYLEAISKEKLPKLEKLSIVSGLNYMTKELYEQLSALVKSGEFKLRFINDNYIDENTIYNYSQSIYFSMSEFLQNVTKVENEKTILKPSTEEIILSLVNDRTDEAKDKYLFYVPSSVSKISVYGNEYDTYNIAFNVMERKQSSVTFDFTSFKDIYTGSESFIFAEKGSRIKINTYLSCEFKSNNKTATLDVWDINIKVQNGDLKIIGINGARGREGDPNVGDWHSNGGDGEKGAYGIKGNRIILLGKIYVSGGNGGNGGNGHAHANKADAGNGGDGAAAIAYREYYLCSTNVVLVGGIGGKVGNPQDFPPFLYGKRGNPGKNAEQIELILDQVPTL